MHFFIKSGMFFPYAICGIGDYDIQISNAVITAPSSQVSNFSNKTILLK